MKKYVHVSGCSKFLAIKMQYFEIIFSWILKIVWADFFLNVTTSCLTAEDSEFFILSRKNTHNISTSYVLFIY